MKDMPSDRPLVRLSDATLAQMPPDVARPTYDRSALTPGIVHIGMGNFHRAHQAWFLHRLMQMGEAQDWAILGAGVLPQDAMQRTRLLAQDCLTTLVELDPSGRRAEICGSMIGFLPVETDNSALIAQMARPEIRIVSLTVTEGGYFIDPSTGGFNASDPDIQHDAAQPGKPRTAFGAMVAASRLRRDAGLGPFTGLSCDNLQGNGRILRQAVVSLARLSDPSLADWIDRNCSFPDSMVDCIVPATGDTERALVRSFGIDDAAPVTHENYRQWVIQDDFCAGRPAWEKVGAVLSADVHDHEQMKIRVLNGGHQLIAPAGDLLGIETIAETMVHPIIHAFLRKVVTQEIAPHVEPVPGCTAAEYLDLIDRRFSNPEIADTTRRVAFDGSSRQPGFLVPSIRDGLSKGVSINGLALATALWARYCLGAREDHSVIPPNDPNWSLLNTQAKAARANPEVWLDMRPIYGDLAEDAGFREIFSDHLRTIYREGVEATLRTYLEH